nr:movement protein [Black currant nucleorhabdovirus 1]
MTSSKTKFSEEFPSKPTKYVSYVAVPIRGDHTEIPVSADGFLLSTKAILYIKNLLSLSSLEVDVKQVSLAWCPLVEPNHLSSVTIKVNYDIAHGSMLQDKDLSLVRLTGKISEQHGIILYPTRPLLYPKGGKLRLPWDVQVEIDGVSEGSNVDQTLGIMKVWCQIKTKPFLSSNTYPMKLYKAPEIKWGNVHFPFYVPYYIINNVRGKTSMEWENSYQYELFSRVVLDHVEKKLINQENTLALMQTMSFIDCTSINELTKNCVLNKNGEYCSCGNKVKDYVEICMKDRDDMYTNHSSIYFETTNGIKKGLIKSSSGARVPEF